MFQPRVFFFFFITSAKRSSNFLPLAKLYHPLWLSKKTKICSWHQTPAAKFFIYMKHCFFAIIHQTVLIVQSPLQHLPIGCSLVPKQVFSFTYFSLIPPIPITSSSKNAWMKINALQVLAVQGDQLAKWESFSRSRELLSLHCSPLLAAQEDLGDTKQEALNKWKLWMFILGHSSGSKTRQRSQDPDPWNKTSRT